MVNLNHCLLIADPLVWKIVEINVMNRADLALLVHHILFGEAVRTIYYTIVKVLPVHIENHETVSDAPYHHWKKKFPSYELRIPALSLVRPSKIFKIPDTLTRFKHGPSPPISVFHPTWFQSDRDDVRALLGLLVKRKGRGGHPLSQRESMFTPTVLLILLLAATVICWAGDADGDGLNEVYR
ncbi:hypothetical protein BU15DRAFT_64682 [Melanogaster broomeanus]|nr:hypothetical protein BU15DRAFT_64682 [Melanogaster broomeanus]